MKHPWWAIAALSAGVGMSVAVGSQARPGRNDAAGTVEGPPSNGSLAPAPAMSAARAAHTATSLPDGRVLVAGGFTEKGSAKGAEIFDAATNSFASTGSLLAARAGHVAVLLRNGKVLVAGGVGPGWDFLSSAELYDPATGRFSPTGSMTVARESHVGVRLADGRVLIVGGHRGRRAAITMYASAEVYDPTTGAFSRAGDMRIPRHKHDGVLLPDGQVLITGGSDERDDRGVFDSSELFDPKSGTFTAGPRMRLGRYKHAGSSLGLPSGLVLIAGGALITGGYGNGGGPRSSAWLYRP